MTVYEAFVYKWTNIITHKKYIGYHKGTEDDGYISSSRYFNEEYVKRPENFKREILAKGSIQDMIMIETTLLKDVNAAKSIEYYNQSNGSDTFYRCGPHSEETKKKLREINKGRKHTQETKNKISNAVKGINHPLFGKKLSSETREKLKISHTGLPSGMKGKKLSQETKDKIRKANLGKKSSDEHRENISKSLIGRKLSSNHANKISESLKKRFSIKNMEK